MGHCVDNVRLISGGSDGGIDVALAERQEIFGIALIWVCEEIVFNLVICGLGVDVESERIKEGFTDELRVAAIFEIEGMIKC